MKKAFSRWLHFLFLLAGILPLRGLSQWYLSIENPNHFKRVQVWPGDTLVLKMEGEKVWYGGILQRVHEESIIFSGDSILLEDVSAVLVARNGTIRHYLGQALKLASLMQVNIPVAFTVNRIYLEVYPVVTVRNIAISASGFLLYFILKPLAGKKYKTKGNWDLVGRETPF